MPNGGVLHLVIRDAAGDIEVEVADNGPGIAAEIAPKLFQPFVSGKDTGLGLGLVISRRIVEDHGGKLTGGNREGGGATFTVTLPKS
jgi:signal transduction histidine kinase